MTRASDIAPGQTFGYLVVLERGQRKFDGLYWKCRCKCGKTREFRGYALAGGTSTSCGCKRSAWRIKHGRTKTPEFAAWQAMLSRCTNKNHPSYPDYGGRGIAVCDRWSNSFENFLTDMGERPSAHHSLDRIDVNGIYEPKNCRWALKKEQANNTRRNRYVVVDGQRLTRSQYLDRVGLK